MKLAAQMYTVAQYTKTLEGIEESLKKIAEIGYKYVQVSGTCSYDAKWLKETLDKYGLKCVITHIPSNKICDEPERAVAEHNTFDCDIIGIGAMPDIFNKDIPMETVYENFYDKFKPAAKKIKELGKKLSYHNHDAEFMVSDKTGTLYYDRLINEFDADELMFTVDTYWIQFGGKDPAKVIRKLKGRCPVVHFKDYKIDRNTDHHILYAACGEGNLDFPEIIEACRYAGVEYIAVEQDDCYGEDPFLCLKRSYEYLKKLGLE